MTEQTSLARRDEPLPATAAQMAAIDPARTGQQLANVEAFLKAQMKRGVHYGKVPGVDKDFLWKSGAELLAALFSFGVRGKRDKDLSVVDRPADLIEITYEATVFSRQTGVDVWAADGFASSAEKCFRARVCPKCKTATRAVRDENRKGMRYCPSCHWEGDEKECGDGLANDFGTSIRNVCARAEKRAKVRAIAEATGVTGFFLTPQTWEQEEDATQHGADGSGSAMLCPTCGKGTLIEKQRRDGSGSFWVCSEGRYDRQTKTRSGCQHTQNDPPGAAPAAESDETGDTPAAEPNAQEASEGGDVGLPREAVATVLDILSELGAKGKQLTALAKAAKACSLTFSGSQPGKWLEAQTDEAIGNIITALEQAE